MNTENDFRAIIRPLLFCNNCGADMIALRSDILNAMKSGKSSFPAWHGDAGYCPHRGKSVEVPIQEVNP